MSRKLSLFFILFSFVFGQPRLSIPEHVWKINISQSFSSGEWIGNGRHLGIIGQNFSVPGYGKRYFDHGYTANAYDLYDLDTLYVDAFNTIGRVMRYYNSDFAPNNNLDTLPNFSKDYFGPDEVLIGGTINEFRTVSNEKTSFDIMYGVSDRVNWKMEIPYYTIQQDRSWEWNSNDIAGYSEWYQYHTNAKAGLEQVLSDTSLQDPFLDKIQAVYDKLYTWESDYSVLWALEGGPDPISSGIYGEGYNPYFVSDTAGITLGQLMDFYWPKSRTVKGVGDIIVGLNFRLFGNPSWKTNEPGLELYTGLDIKIPLGSTLTKYTVSSSTFPNSPAQVKQLPLGDGVTVWRFYLNGAWKRLFDRRIFAIQWYFENGISSKESLHAPVNLLGTSFMHHDSTIFSIGEKYLYRKGYQMRSEILANYELFPSILSTWAGLNIYWKNRDEFISGNNEWNSWMSHHDGYDTQQISFYIKGGIKYHNMNPIKRIFPLLFELELNGFAPIFIRNQYRLYGVRVIFTTYLQNW